MYFKIDARQRGRFFSRDYGNERSLQRPECTGLHGTKRRSREKRNGLTFKYAKTNKQTKIKKGMWCS